MNARLFLFVGGCLLGLLSPARGDGFIIFERPVPVPIGHFPFAPLEVAVTSIDQEFYNPNDQRLEGTYIFPVPKDAHIDKFSMEIGGKMVEAELLPAEKAR